MGVGTPVENKSIHCYLLKSSIGNNQESIKNLEPESLKKKNFIKSHFCSINKSLCKCLFFVIIKIKK